MTRPASLYKAHLRTNGEDVKVVQELMRHANISVTITESKWG